MIFASRRKQLQSLLPTWKRERERDYQPSLKKTFTILTPHQEPGRGSPEVIAKDAINLYLIFTAVAQLLRKCRAGNRNWVMFKDLRWPGPIALTGQASERGLLGTASMAGEEWAPQHALRSYSKTPILPVQPHDRNRKLKPQQKSMPSSTDTSHPSSEQETAVWGTHCLWHPVLRDPESRRIAACPRRLGC